MQPFAIGRCEFPQVQQTFGLIPKEGGVRVHVSLGASSDLGEAILIGTKANMNVRSSARNNIATHWFYIGLTKLRFLWNELNFLVRKYFGRMVSANSATSKIRKAFPESDHVITL